MKFPSFKIILPFLFLLFSFKSTAQDERAQLPLALRNAYFGVSVGSINYDFGSMPFQAPAGYFLNSVVVKHPAVRLVLYGYEFNKYLSAQLTYMRPVWWVFYYYDHGAVKNERSSVWMNVGGLTLRPQIPISDKIYLNGEAGLGIVTRHGFNAEDGTPIVTGVSYPTVLLGGGVNYHINDNWRLMLSGTYSPKKASVNQPATTFISTGFNYKLTPVSDKKLEEGIKTGYINPKQWLQIGFSSNITGYGINNSLEKASLFWGGDVEVYKGLSINYQRNIFHSAKYFALDWGMNASAWQTRGLSPYQTVPKKEAFYTFSVFPVFRYNFLHTQPVDAYFYYSVAGPSYISKIVLDGVDTGKHFTFQVAMGLGIFF